LSKPDEILITFILNSLEATYWILVNVTDILKELNNRVSYPLKLHTVRVYNRAKIITETLGEGLRHVGIQLKKPPSKEELDKRAEPFATDILEALKEAVEEIKNLNSKQNPLKLVSYLERFREPLEATINFFEHYKSAFEESNFPKKQHLTLALQIIIDDLNIIKQKSQKFIEDSHHCFDKQRYSTSFKLFNLFLVKFLID